MGVRVYLFSILRFTPLYFFVRDGKQLVHQTRELAILRGMFHCASFYTKSFVSADVRPNAATKASSTGRQSL